MYTFQEKSPLKTKYLSDKCTPPAGCTSKIQVLLCQQETRLLKENYYGKIAIYIDKTDRNPSELNCYIFITTSVKQAKRFDPDKIISLGEIS